MGKTVLAKKTQILDLEYQDLRVEEGKTYYDDGSTIFDVYISDGLLDGSFVEVARHADTIPVKYNGR